MQATRTLPVAGSISFKYVSPLEALSHIENVYVKPTVSVMSVDTYVPAVVMLYAGKVTGPAAADTEEDADLLGVIEMLKDMLVEMELVLDMVGVIDGLGDTDLLGQ